MILRQNFALCSLIRTFDYVEGTIVPLTMLKVLSLDNKNK